MWQLLFNQWHMKVEGGRSWEVVTRCPCPEREDGKFVLHWRFFSGCPVQVVRWGLTEYYNKNLTSIINEQRTPRKITKLR